VKKIETERNTYFTADEHFGHKSILKYCRRPFATVEDMDNEIIARRNDVVGSNDVVYGLGDFTLSEDPRSYFAQLNGIARIVPGGHDRRWIKKYRTLYTRDAEVEILPPLFTLKIPIVDRKHPLAIVLCHYSLRIWSRSHYGSFHCFGHSHGRLPEYGRSMDVGVDAHDFYPVSLQEVFDTLSVRRNVNELEHD